MEFSKKTGQTVVTSWANQNKQQPIVYLDSGFYLTTKISPFLIISLSLTHTHARTRSGELVTFSTYTVLQSRDSNFPSQESREATAGPGRQKTLPWFLLCICLPLPVLEVAGQASWVSPGICLHAALWSPKFFPHFQDISSTQDLHILVSVPPSSFRDPVFFLRILLFGTTSSSWDPTPPVFPI